MQEELRAVICNSISDGVSAVDKNCIVTPFNHSGERITGFTAKRAVGNRCFDIFRTEICHKQCAPKNTLKTEDPQEDARVTIISEDGHEVPIQMTTTLLRDDEKNIIGSVEFFRDVVEIENLPKRLDRENALSDIVSVTPRMQELISLLPDVAESECTVLILGPGGSGKGLIAQVIHNLSPRRYRPYVKLNCAALPAQLLESELFGYEKGAFTDAERDKPGQCSLANGGTLLLDEISEMDVSPQVKPLRVLSNGEYRPLGSMKTLHTDTGIIAATNADLQESGARGIFREDLYYRINVANLEIPTVRERPADLPLLVDHFMDLFRNKNRMSIKRIAPDAMSVLRKHRFMGNVQELENTIEHAFITCHGQEIQPEQPPLHIVHHTAGNNGICGDRRSEREIILKTLGRHNGNRLQAAAELGVHRSTLWRKIRSYGIDI